MSLIRSLKGKIAGRRSGALLGRVLRPVRRGMQTFLDGTADLVAPPTIAPPDAVRPDYLDYCQGLRSRVGATAAPVFSVIVPVAVAATSRKLLVESLASVAAQSARRWQLCVSLDDEPDPALSALLSSFRDCHPEQVVVVTKAKTSSGSRAEACNAGLALACGDYSLFLRPGDRLYPHALSELARALLTEADAEVVYGDSRAIGVGDDPVGPVFFKPDWSPLMHLAFHYPGPMVVYRTRLLQSLGGLRSDLDGAEDYDLMLRAVEATTAPVVHVPLLLLQERMPASIGPSEDSVRAATVRALTEACQRRGRPAQVQPDPSTGHYRTRFALPEPLPLISILVPTRDCYELIERCLRSIYSLSTYPRFEVLLVDHQSTDSRCLALWRELEQTHGDRFRRLSVDGSFNFARFNNEAARAARGEYLVLLNNDTEVITPDWLTELLSFAQHPEIAAVGPKLLYGDRRIQNAGIYLYGTSIAGTAYERVTEHDPWFFHLLDTPREMCAVTAACLMVARDKYLAVGGLDEDKLPNGYGDVDFCLKLRERGMTCVYTPYAQLFHHESQSRGRTIEQYEHYYMQRRWGGLLLSDPYLNPNLVRGSQLVPMRDPPPLDLSANEFRQLLLRQPWYAEQAP